jgi:hypothetical protein
MIFKNKIPATSIRQKPFSKLSHVAHMKWLSVDVKSALHAKHTASQISWLHTRGPGIEIRKRASQFSLKLTKDENG